MSEELGPLSGVARELLAAERARPDLPAERLERLASRLDVSFALATPEATGTAAAATAKAASGAAMAWKAAVLSFAAGTLVGVGVTRVALSPAQPAVETAPAREVPTVREPPAAVPQEPAVAAPEPVRAPAVGGRPAPLPGKQDRLRSREKLEPDREPASPAAADQADVGQERALLEMAQVALGRGKGSEALDALGQHQSRFPRGELREERESLRIQALLALGRTDEARSAAAAFHERFPTSILWPAIEAALSVEP
jgi:hypothetical protein